MARRAAGEGDAQSLADVRAQEAAQEAAEGAATAAAAEGGSQAEVKAAAREAAEEALEKFRLHQEDVDRIANASAEAQIRALREGGAFEPTAQPSPDPAAPAAGETPAPAVAAPASAPPPPAPLEPAEPPRKLSWAERFAGVEHD